MHEYALADAVVATVLATAAQERLARVLAVEVQIGALQSIDRATFLQALQSVLPAEEPRLAGVRFDLSTVPVALRCRPCGARHEPDLAVQADAHATEAMHFVPELAHAYLRCPQCDSPDFDIVAGRGVTIGKIEGERNT